MDDSHALADAFARHLSGFTETLSKIVSDGTNFGQCGSLLFMGRFYSRENHLNSFPDGLTRELVSILTLRLFDFNVTITLPQLDTAEQKLGLAACYMRTIRNSRQAACKLPREVLDLIFAQTMDRFKDFDPFPIRPERGGRWHPSIISGVCRYWRVVTISCPTIWSTIHLSDVFPSASLSFAQLCLRRSYGAPLNVYIDYQNGVPEDAMNWISEDLVAQSVRFSAFHLREHDQHLSRALYEVLSECPAPSLQSLTLQPDVAPTLPDLLDPLLFAGFLPSIKHVTTSRLKLWPTYRLTSLTHICVRASAFSVSEVFDLLACNPQLEVIILQSDDPTPHDLEDNTPTTTVGISLSHLRRFHLVDYTTTFCTRILNVIRPPPALNLAVDYVTPAPSHTLLSTISRLSFIPTISTVVLRSSLYPARLGIRGVGLGAFNISPGADVHEAGSNQYMAGLLALLSACSIKEIWIEGDQVVTRVPLWQRIFLATPLVSRLVVSPGRSAHESPGTAFFSALCAADETLGLALPCPLLTELILRGGFNGQDNTRAQRSLWFTRDLRQFCEDRKSRGFPLRKITLILSADSSIPPAAELAQIKRLVATVDCIDGRNFSTYSSSRVKLPVT
ncbi:uncharacterized protein PHACADRAFT_181368 [Phanerochaete carnosa HHB-10118-sp]|uniref:F-box domain-containing protein n=1 Tax=Phanerochaete carnosa (strain HHB-10118-sp) TaxID=650164 RepID=K5WJ24_PHACS|nr:uncharacterized protein PHACADRAFT_181368 [Phanerochaete carnosa HHB-10118-sp]EKM59365.1 hypothetical protein PHACADRAFT_181368 [Phanerochaete carnosa HHB-10118-sp]